MLTIAPPTAQLLLFTQPPSWTITRNAQARNAYGTVAAELTCTLLHLVPIPIHGGYDCCFDAFNPVTGSYHEIKSVHRSGKVVIYDWRMKKEQRAMKDGINLFYTILVHRLRGSDGRDIAGEMAVGGLEILLLPAQTVHTLATTCPLNHHKSITWQNERHGYNRAGYVEGYRNVSVKLLREQCTVSAELSSSYGPVPITCTLRAETGSRFNG